MSGLTIGSNFLTPPFDADVFEYTVETANMTNKVTAMAAENVEIAITLANTSGSSTVENGTAVTWAEGENILTIKAGGKTTYTATVTKS